MLKRIIDNLREHPQDVCYERSGAVCRSGELYRYVCAIRRFLLERNPLKKPVAVCGRKEVYMIASFLACSCAGMPYVPIDASLPEARRRRILAQIGPAVTIDASIEPFMLQACAEELPEPEPADDDVYYIIFTSGSTAEPKGVQITYGNLKNCMSWLEGLCRTEGGIVLNQASFSFDLSVADLYLPLLTRGRHYILEREIQREYGPLFSELRRSGAELAVFTPSFLDLLLVDRSFDERLMPRLKTVLLCGERLTKRTAGRLFERFPGIRLINCYGPTECTFAATSAEITDPDDLPIGSPKDGTKVYLVNDRLEEVPEEQPGEILITGAGVGKGYLGGACGGFLQYNGERAYLTGDYGYRRDGKLYFIGRKDTQIKLKGYRIELAEIEDALCALGEVEQAVVTVKTRDEKACRILAFVKRRPDCPVGPNEIRKRLASELPDYMLPTVRLVDEIPLNENGKADVRALLEEAE